jgi:hypothetical protein
VFRAFVENRDVQYDEIVAIFRTLYRMKRDTVRPSDRIDAEVLKRAFKLEDD